MRDLVKLMYGIYISGEWIYFRKVGMFYCKFLFSNLLDDKEFDLWIDSFSGFVLCGLFVVFKWCI